MDQRGGLNRVLIERLDEILGTGNARNQGKRAVRLEELQQFDKRMSRTAQLVEERIGRTQLPEEVYGEFETWFDAIVNDFESLATLDDFVNQSVTRIDDETSQLDQRVQDAIDAGEAQVEELRAEILGQNFIFNNGLINATGWTGATSMAVRPPVAEAGTNSLRLVAGDDAYEATFATGNVNGSQYRLTAWVLSDAPFTFELQGLQTDVSPQEQVSTQAIIPSSAEWQLVDVVVDGNVDTVEFGAWFSVPAGATTTIHEPSLTRLGTVTDQIVTYTNTILTLADENGLLATLRDELSAEFGGEITTDAGIYTYAVENPADLTQGAGYTFAQVVPGPFGQPTAVNITHVSGNADAFAFNLPDNMAVALAGNGIKIDVLARKNTADAFTVAYIDQAGGRRETRVEMPTTNWAWYEVLLEPVDTDDDQTTAIAIIPDADFVGGSANFGRIIVRVDGLLDPRTAQGTLTADVASILDLSVDDQTALGQFRDDVETGLKTVDGTTELNAQVEQQGTAITELDGNLATLNTTVSASQRTDAARALLNTIVNGALAAEDQLTDIIEANAEARTQKIALTDERKARVASVDKLTASLLIEGDERTRLIEASAESTRQALTTLIQAEATLRETLQASFDGVSAQVDVSAGALANLQGHAQSYYAIELSADGSEVVRLAGYNSNNPNDPLFRGFRIDGSLIVSKSITAAAGVIADLAVDTLQLADQSVTFPVALSAPDFLELTSDRSWRTVMELNLGRVNSGPANVWFGAIIHHEESPTALDPTHGTRFDLRMYYGAAPNPNSVFTGWTSLVAYGRSTPGQSFMLQIPEGAGAQYIRIAMRTVAPTFDEAAYINVISPRLVYLETKK